MPDETIFRLVSFGVVPFWLLLAAAPRWRWTDRLVHSGLPAALLVPVYVWMIFFDQPGPEGASFFTLQGVMNIFTTPRTVIGCWIHYLVFDLFVGAWEARDGHRLGIPHLLVVPCLALTLAFGPVGLAAYLVLRATLRRRVTLVEGGQHGAVAAAAPRAPGGV